MSDVIFQATHRRAAITAEALSWLGTPYHHRACIQGAGVDCAMLLYAVYVETLKLVPPFAFEDYPHDWMLHRAEERFMQHVKAHAIEVTAPQPGDVALYKVGRCFAHGAIVLNWPCILHADSRVGAVTLSNGEQGHLAGREVKFFRVIGNQEHAT